MKVRVMKVQIFRKEPEGERNIYEAAGLAKLPPGTLSLHLERHGRYESEKYLYIAVLDKC